MLNQIPTDFGIPAESQFQGFGIEGHFEKSRGFRVAPKNLSRAGVGRGSPELAKREESKQNILIQRCGFVAAVIPAADRIALTAIDAGDDRLRYSIQRRETS